MTLVPHEIHKIFRKIKIPKWNPFLSTVFEIDDTAYTSDGHVAIAIRNKTVKIEQPRSYCRKTGTENQTHDHYPVRDMFGKVLNNGNPPPSVDYCLIPFHALKLTDDLRIALNIDVMKVNDDNRWVISGESDDYILKVVTTKARRHGFLPQ